MTDLIQALSTALARLATLEEIVARLDNLESNMFTMESTVVSMDRRVDTLENDMRGLESGDDLDDRVGAILDRKLDHVLEDAVTEALSGREITITL
jgi:hypothetical protein